MFCFLFIFADTKSYAADMSGTHSSGTKTYTIGNGGTYQGVAAEGFTISGGNLTLEAVGPFFTFHGPITITGGTLTIKFSSNYSGSGSNLKREVESSLLNSSGYIPYGASSGTIAQYGDSLFIVEGGTLNIEGLSDRTMSLSGAGQSTLDIGNGICTFPATSDTSDDVEAKGPLINVSGTGHVNLKYVNLTSNYNNKNSGGALAITGSNPVVRINNCKITKCVALSNGSVMHISADGGSIVINDTTIENNFTYASTETTGGTIRCNGLNMCTLELNNTIIQNNYSRIASGAIAWNAMRIDPLIVNNCTIKGNVSTDGNGGIGCQSRMNITGATKIINNKSINGNGGGLAISTWGSQQLASGFELTQDGNVVLGPDVIISGNSCGGIGAGIYFKVGIIKTNTSPSPPNNMPIQTFSTKSDGTPYSMSLIINGATIENNVAQGNGGGIAMEKLASSPYIMQIQMNSGLISNNITTSNGAAAYLLGNGADFIMNGGKIENHTSASNGGAVYTDGGSFKMTAGTIQNNSAKNNGTVFISSGNFEMSGGNISRNSSQNGGAVYISGGNSTITGGTIESCQATNGGGIYISNGNLLMDGGIISNNQSSESGGGIYASSDSQDLSVKISSGSIIGNIAAKNGGGLAINMKENLNANVTIGLESCQGLDESHSHPIIKDNTANGNGGGFWLDGDNMTMNMYCGSIKENIAVLEPGSANIYQTGGNATVYAGEVGEGVIVIGGEYVYIPNNQENEITIIYNSNNPDNPEQKNAKVTVGVEIYLPKNLFIREDYVLVGWAHVPNPTVNDTIYTVGEPYIVGENDITVYAIWLLEGSGTTETPVINSGKNYDEITGGTNIIISSNSAITVQMNVLQIQPNYYTNRSLVFDKNLINGTNITMVDFSNTNEKIYYYYKIKDDDTNKIMLDSFIKNGTSEKYVNSTSSVLTDEKLLFIIELPENNNETMAMQITLKRDAANNELAPIEQAVTFTTTPKRNFQIVYNEGNAGSDANIGDIMSFSYIKANTVGVDTRYTNKNIALMITGTNGSIIPEDAQIFDGTNYYKVNGKGKFIIPLGSIENNKELNLQLISDILTENGIDCNIKAELWVANRECNPCMGEKVAESENINLKAIELPAVKVELDKNSYNQDEFSGDLKLEYETIDIEAYDVTIELQKKVSNNSYVTQTDLLTSVDGNSENTDGVFNIELNESGNIDLEFAEGFEENSGTYRVLISGEDSSGNEFEIPCNFMKTE